MSPDQADQSTGYRPVKPARGKPAILAAGQKLMTDAIAAVVEKHRAKRSARS